MKWVCMLRVEIYLLQKKRGEGFVSYAGTVTFKKSAQQMLLNTLVFLQFNIEYTPQTLWHC